MFTVIGKAAELTKGTVVALADFVVAIGNTECGHRTRAWPPCPHPPPDEITIFAASPRIGEY